MCIFIKIIDEISQLTLKELKYNCIELKLRKNGCKFDLANKILEHMFQYKESI